MWEAIVDRVDLSFDDNIALLAFLRRLFFENFFDDCDD